MFLHNVFSYSSGFHEFMHNCRRYRKMFPRIDVNDTASTLTSSRVKIFLKQNLTYGFGARKRTRCDWEKGLASLGLRLAAALKILEAQTQSAP